MPKWQTHQPAAPWQLGSWCLALLMLLLACPAAGTPPPPPPSPPPAAPPAYPYQGLHEDMYTNIGTLTTMPNFTALTPSNSLWLTQLNDVMPAPFSNSQTANNWGAVITGYVVIPTTGSWTFYIRSDDGSYLYLDGVRIINNCACVQGVTERASTSSTVTSGYHAIKVEYFQASGGAVLGLSWEGPSVTKAYIPSSALTAYLPPPPPHPPPPPAYPTNGLSATWYPISCPDPTTDCTTMPDFTTLTAGAWFNVPNINYATPAATATTYFWANGYANYFAVRFLGYIAIPATGIYTFRTTSDDGSKVWVNGTLVVDNNHVGGAPVTITNTSVVLAAGMQPFELQFFQRRGPTSLGLYWQPPSGSAVVAIPATNFYYFLQPPPPPPPPPLPSPPPPVAVPAPAPVPGSPPPPSPSPSPPPPTMSGPPPPSPTSPPPPPPPPVPAVVPAPAPAPVVAGSQPPPPPPSYPINGLSVIWYKCPNCVVMPDFSTLTAAAWFNVDDVNFPASSTWFWANGNLDNYANRFIGYILIPTAGTWTFGLESEDGSMLYIDGQLVINNDGMWGPPNLQTAVTTLDAGYWPIEVQFFKAYATSTLLLTWQAPSESSRVAVPSSNLFYFPGPPLPPAPAPAPSLLATAPLGAVSSLVPVPAPSEDASVPAPLDSLLVPAPAEDAPGPAPLDSSPVTAPAPVPAPFAWQPAPLLVDAPGPAPLFPAPVPALGTLAPQPAALEAPLPAPSLSAPLPAPFMSAPLPAPSAADAPAAVAVPAPAPAPQSPPAPVIVIPPWSPPPRSPAPPLPVPPSPPPPAPSFPPPSNPPPPPPPSPPPSPPPQTCNGVRRPAVCDATPPVILLLGNQSMQVPALTKFKEPGASAQDDSDGLVRYNATLSAPVNTSQLTPPGQPYTITYTAMDNCCNQATPVVRTVAVVDPCPAPEFFCTDKGTCSQFGLCFSAIGVGKAAPPPATPPPTIQLITTPSLPARVTVPQYSTYQACASGLSPTSSQLCEPGATASGALDGNITAHVVACAPANCTSQLTCAASEMRKVGLTYCSVNTSLAVGSIIPIKFTVYDMLGSKAEATRLLTIGSPCPAGQYYCSGSCLPVTCALAALLGSRKTPPVISLSTGAKPVFDANATLWLEYGTAPAISLLPCTSAGSQQNCAVVGQDAQDGDLSASIQITAIEQCVTGEVNCFECDPSYLASGLCLPGAYLYQYTLTDSSGANAVPVALQVKIYEMGQTTGAVAFLTNASDTTAAHQAAAALAAMGSPDNVQLVAAMAKALTQWLKLQLPVYSGTDPVNNSPLQLPSGFSITEVAPQDVTVTAADSLAGPVEDVLGLAGRTASLHYGVNVTLRIVVRAGPYPTDSVGNLHARRKLLQHPHSAVNGQPGRQLQQTTGLFDWVSVLNTKLSVIGTAFSQVAQCNATSLELRLFHTTNSSTKVEGCATSGAAILLDQQLAGAVAGTAVPPLQVLSLSFLSEYQRTSPPVDVPNGLAISASSSVAYTIQQQAAGLKLILNLLNVVANINFNPGPSLNLLALLQRYLSEGTASWATLNTEAQALLKLFSVTLTQAASYSNAAGSASASVQLLQAQIASSNAARNSMLSSPSFQNSLAGGQTNCSRSLNQGNMQIAFQVGSATAASGRRRLAVMHDGTASVAEPELHTGPGDTDASDTHLHGNTQQQRQHEGSSASALSRLQVQQRRKLAEGASAPSSFFYGYVIQQVGNATTMPNLPVPINRQRYVGVQGSNIVVGGILLNQIRRPTACGSKFDTLNGACSDLVLLPYSNTLVPGSAANQCPADMPEDMCPIKMRPYGIDPVFNPVSVMYDPRLAGLEDQYYNTSDGSGDYSPEKRPYGFQQRNMAAYPTGFPIVLTTRTSAARAQTLLQYLQYGRYLDASSLGMTAQVLTYNSDSRVFGYVRIDFYWGAQGSVQTKFEVDALPLLLISRTKVSPREVLITFVGCLMVVGYTAFVASIWIRRMRMNAAAAAGDSTGAAASSLPDGLSRQTLLFNTLVCLLQLVALALMLTYLGLQAKHLRPKVVYDIYDNEIDSRAHFFLAAKHDPPAAQQNTTTSQAGVIGMATAANVPRWQLDDDNTDLNAFSSMFSLVDRLRNLQVAYTSLQGIALLCLMFSAIQALTFQHKLGIVPRTLLRALTDLVNFFIVLLICLLGIAFAAHIAMGNRRDVYSNLASAIQTWAVAVLSRPLPQDPDTGSVMNTAEHISFSLFSYACPIFFLVMYAFVMSIINAHFIEESVYAEVDEATQAKTHLLTAYLLEKWQQLHEQAMSSRRIVLLLQPLAAKTATTAQPSARDVFEQIKKRALGPELLGLDDIRDCISMLAENGLLSIARSNSAGSSVSSRATDPNASGRWDADSTAGSDYMADLGGSSHGSLHEYDDEAYEADTVSLLRSQPSHRTHSSVASALKKSGSPQPAEEEALQHESRQPSHRKLANSFSKSRFAIPLQPTADLLEEGSGAHMAAPSTVQPTPLPSASDQAPSSAPAAPADDAVPQTPDSRSLSAVKEDQPDLAATAALQQPASLNIKFERLSKDGSGPSLSSRIPGPSWGPPRSSGSGSDKGISRTPSLRTLRPSGGSGELLGPIPAKRQGSLDRDGNGGSLSDRNIRKLLSSAWRSTESPPDTRRRSHSGPDLATQASVSALMDKVFARVVKQRAAAEAGAAGSAPSQSNTQPPQPEAGTSINAASRVRTFNTMRTSSRKAWDDMPDRLADAGEAGVAAAAAAASSLPTPHPASRPLMSNARLQLDVTGSAISRSRTSQQPSPSQDMGGSSAAAATTAAAAAAAAPLDLPRMSDPDSEAAPLAPAFAPLQRGGSNTSAMLNKVWARVQALKAASSPTSPQAGTPPAAAASPAAPAAVLAPSSGPGAPAPDVPQAHSSSITSPASLDSVWAELEARRQSSLSASSSSLEREASLPMLASVQSEGQAASLSPQTSLSAKVWARVARQTSKQAPVPVVWHSNTLAGDLQRDAAGDELGGASLSASVTLTPRQLAYAVITVPVPVDNPLAQDSSAEEIRDGPPSRPGTAPSAAADAPKAGPTGGAATGDSDKPLRASVPLPAIPKLATAAAAATKKSPRRGADGRPEGSSGHHAHAKLASRASLTPRSGAASIPTSLAAAKEMLLTPRSAAGTASSSGGHGKVSSPFLAPPISIKPAVKRRPAAARSMHLDVTPSSPLADNTSPKSVSELRASLELPGTIRSPKASPETRPGPKLRAKLSATGVLKIPRQALPPLDASMERLSPTALPTLPSKAGADSQLATATTVGPKAILQHIDGAAAAGATAVPSGSRPMSAKNPFSLAKFRAVVNAAAGKKVGFADEQPGGNQGGGDAPKGTGKARRASQLWSSVTSAFTPSAPVDQAPDPSINDFMAALQKMTAQRTNQGLKQGPAAATMLSPSASFGRRSQSPVPGEPAGKLGFADAAKQMASAAKLARLLRQASSPALNPAISRISSMSSGGSRRSSRVSYNSDQEAPLVPSISALHKKNSTIRATARMVRRLSSMANPQGAQYMQFMQEQGQGYGEGSPPYGAHSGGGYPGPGPSSSAGRGLKGKLSGDAAVMQLKAMYAAAMREIDVVVDLIMDHLALMRGLGVQLDDMLVQVQEMGDNLPQRFCAPSD